MNELIASADGLAPAFELLLAVLAGAALGAIFFGGLWWTTRRATASSRPALWFFGSLLLRTGVALAGFLAVADGHWERMLACLLGFVAARTIVIRMTRLPPGGAWSSRGAEHAP